MFSPTPCAGHLQRYRSTTSLIMHRPRSTKAIFRVAGNTAICLTVRRGGRNGGGERDLWPLCFVCVLFSGALMNSPQSARNDDAEAGNNMEAVFCRSLLIYLSICSGLSSSTQIHCSAVNHAHAARCSVSYCHPHITLCPEFLWLPQPAVAPNPPLR